MKYISCDIETFGLDANENDIIQVAAVFDPLTHTEDGMLIPLDKLPTFECFIGRKNQNIKANLVAMKMHQDSGLLARWVEADRVKSEVFVNLFEDWLWEVWPLKSGEKYNFAGKNFAGFDRRFLNTIPEFARIDKNIHHRVLDPSEFYLDLINDTAKPDLNECLKRAGIDKSVSHHALDDCFDVVKLIRYAAFK